MGAMEIIISFIGIIIISLILFILTGLLGWSVHNLEAIVGFLAQGSLGSKGCLLKILAAIFVFLALIAICS